LTKANQETRKNAAMVEEQIAASRQDAPVASAARSMVRKVASAFNDNAAVAVEQSWTEF